MNHESTMDNAFARKGQLLRTHSENVAKLAAMFGSKCGVSETAKTAGFNHDLGKTSEAFQTMLEGSVESGYGTRHSEDGKRPRHSIYGGKRAFTDASNFPCVADILGNVITAHHGSLYDGLSPEGDTPLYDRLTEAELFLQDPYAPDMDYAKMNSELLCALEKLHSDDKEFGMSMLIKFVYSCLVDADRLDAYLHENGLKYQDYEREPPDWGGLLSKLHLHLDKISKNGVYEKMSAYRNKISADCEISGSRERGVYKLEVPTGGGKTLASLRFALAHASKHEMDRIIYVIPYLSILSQTADAIKNAMDGGDELVLEHHSGFLPDEPQYYKLQIGRWDMPIILTTQVQFLESIFSAKGSDLRKLHSMANSVLIFDEAQSLPVKCVHLFNGVINFLHGVCNSTVLLCTATQPLLDKVEQRHRLRFSDNESIAECGQVIKRTQIVNAMKHGGYSYPDLADFILQQDAKSTLVIVNTKIVAKELCTELSSRGVDVLHLSTNMCAAHRDDVINLLRQKLRNNEPVVCVSTQLIEAGVDISVECVVREVAGLDSIWQAAGRCNRHGEFGEVKDVFVVNIAGSNIGKLPDIREGAAIACDMLDNNQGEDIDAYYVRYFHVLQGIMDYPVNTSNSIYNLLTSNTIGRAEYIKRSDKKNVTPPALLSAIRSAADEFYVIDKGRTDVIVKYGNAMELLKQYRDLDSSEEKRGVLRELRKYSVSLYAYQVKELGNAICDADGLRVLSGHYNEVFGIDFEGRLEFICD